MFGMTGCPFYTGDAFGNYRLNSFIQITDSATAINSGDFGSDGR